MISTGSSRADDLLLQGMQASQSKDSDLALKLFRQASAEAPSSGVTHFLIASELASRGEMSQAEEAFANSVLLAPDLTIARYQLGLLQFCSNRAALALITWQPLLDLPQSDPLPHFVRGFAALSQDEFAQALSHYQAGLERNHDNLPLSTDIRLLIDRIQPLLHPAAGSTLSGTDMNDPFQATEDSDISDGKAHVLLSNYRKQGLFH